jgi:hypothetical protein
MEGTIPNHNSRQINKISTDVAKLPKTAAVKKQHSIQAMAS